MFIICACIYFFGGLIYVVFLDAEIQPWAVLENTDQNDEKNVNNKKENIFPLDAKYKEEKHIVKF